MDIHIRRTTVMESILPGSIMSVITGIYLLIVSTFVIQGVEASIGVNYGTMANNLPPPSQVADFLLKSTIINRVRLFDANPDILRAFAHTDIAITVTVPDDQILNLTDASFAQQWVKSNIEPYFPATSIIRILVGNEVLSTANKLLIGSLVPAMQTLHTALVSASLDNRIKISTPHSFGILSNSSPPSAGRFHQGYDTHVLKPLLSFLQATNAPFLINPYPFFDCLPETLDYALFRPNPGMFDENTGILYTNMLDAQLDAVFSAMKLLGYPDTQIVIGETGWPSLGDSTQVGVDPRTASEFNGNLIKHVTSGVGTPLMPNKTFETYIFALFNEDLKPGPTCERNFGLFNPNMTPVYDVQIFRTPARLSVPKDPNRVPIFSPEPPPGEAGQPREKRWCVPRDGAKSGDLQRNIDYVCGCGLECSPIQKGGMCFYPNTVHAHAAYAMNAYFQASGGNDFDCDFKNTAALTTIDPSYGNCRY